MAVMGEAPPEAWAEEFRRTGRVVFPLRRRSLVMDLAQPPFVVALVGFQLPRALDAGGAMRISYLVLVAALPLAIGFSVWQLVTQRPALTVDHEGIRFRRKFMPWSEIGAIGIATGPVWFGTMPIIPKDVWAKDLRLYQRNVRDLPAFRRWLETLLDEHRRSSSSGATTCQ